ncbi:uncharacterized protein LOC100907412 [Galendromus occidentalis]|uniref:Uncharacterized protein LOC100907412 n=1 Tax=Galendromus occidentalis TaxID=34638 RepID=A0AAJ6VW95_9ACAR|nr:uncharacterized protein LOC100907412 [Galendromus occidentalis]
MAFYVAIVLLVKLGIIVDQGHAQGCSLQQCAALLTSMTQLCAENGEEQIQTVLIDPPGSNRPPKDSSGDSRKPSRDRLNAWDRPFSSSVMKNHDQGSPRDSDENPFG